MNLLLLVEHYPSQKGGKKETIMDSQNIDKSDHHIKNGVELAETHLGQKKKLAETPKNNNL